MFPSEVAHLAEEAIDRFVQYTRAGVPAEAARNKVSLDLMAGGCAVSISQKGARAMFPSEVAHLAEEAIDRFLQYTSAGMPAEVARHKVSLELDIMASWSRRSATADDDVDPEERWTIKQDVDDCLIVEALERR